MNKILVCVPVLVFSLGLTVPVWAGSTASNGASPTSGMHLKSSNKDLGAKQTMTTNTNKVKQEH